MKFSRRSDGFTLIEVLIVVSILAILMSLIVVTVQKARVKAISSVAAQYVNTLTTALEQFREDEGYSPGSEYDDPEMNAFPALYEALLGDPEESDKAGRSAPYLEVKEKDIGVRDEDTESYRQADLDEIRDPRVEKFILDPWNEPYFYRENKSKGKDWPGRRRHKFDLWSTGPDRENQTLDEDEEKSDDLGNW